MDNNKITELRAILQGKVKTHKCINRQISQQPENCENRNDPDLVQTFLKKWWVESDFKVPNLPLSLRLKGSSVVQTSYTNALQRSLTFDTSSQSFQRQDDQEVHAISCFLSEADEMQYICAH
jgi:hypothetical protein